jgi:hypothetical protein
MSCSVSGTVLSNYKETPLGGEKRKRYETRQALCKIIEVTG